jgi:DNA-binding transcriptional regulator YhcF (GntR family)
MDILVSRKGGVPVREQIRAQVELKILDGELRATQRLPSVRSLARRLHVHPNTVSAAYHELEVAGLLELKTGSGVFVRRSLPGRIEEAADLDEMIRIALQKAFDRGYSGEEVRAAVERWLAAAPPDHVVVVDPSLEMGELLAEELRRAVGVPVACCTFEDAAREPGRLSGVLAVVLPYQLETLRALAPGVAVEAVNLEVSRGVRDAILALPEGTIVLGVSYAPPVLPFASVLFHSLRGDDLVVEMRPLSAGTEWKRLVRAADVVFVDSLAAETVKKSRPRRVIDVRLVPEAALRRLREALAVVVPRMAKTAPMNTRREKGSTTAGASPAPAGTSRHRNDRSRS